jgi:deoxyadenosine/deoxycytidine kinase
MARVFVAIAGNIGSGKTTLTKLLSERFGWEPYYESVQDNPYLADFYQDMTRWAYQLQSYFLTRRFADHERILSVASSVIQDRTIYEDTEIFARNLYETGKMDERDWNVYSLLAEVMFRHIAPPDLMVYVRRSVPKLLARIKKRGRAYEQGIPIDYLARLNQMYERWIAGYQRGRVFIIESDKLDFLEKPEHLQTVAEKIAGALAQRDLFFASP